MLNIKYTKAKFIFRFTKDSILPQFKSSALRGVLGKALITFNCIGDENCNKCYFKKSCIVQNIMSHGLREQVEFVPKNTSISSFVIECEDERTNFKKGDILEFYITIFGDSIVFFPQYLYAFQAMENVGLGSYNAKYELVQVSNDIEEPIFYDNEFLKFNIKIRTLEEYVSNRFQQIPEVKTINFTTPFRVLKKGKLVRKINYKDIIIALYRRLIILNALDGIKVDNTIIDLEGNIEEVNSEWINVKRHSNRQKQDMNFGGVTGKFILPESINEIKEYILAGEIIHIGKNTSFGLGKFEIGLF
ncbi:hypothetical protein CLOACE_04530 [Clostridium acetireducens DSM 10703]|uniref:CRISPR-associated protein Cas6 C-terminal domain-containing protein n=1 Tax=Clostridium acetireducens DSM 10703 TaxID=1121290 RepID=A0A1E8F0U0_9CLOT|nr:CRISPR system precrRNA processing endoribonuclease RAMP protein Cas6 [Clostridium acetireducens]OFI07048.1 hypothetical protein CLOACE_04530 [Clostridium acetireducens DSM 10703]